MEYANGGNLYDYIVHGIVQREDQCDVTVGDNKKQKFVVLYLYSF
jgi:hypothetical protein